MTLDTKALEAAYYAATTVRLKAIDVAGGDAVAAMLGGGSAEPARAMIDAAIEAYLSAVRDGWKAFAQSENAPPATPSRNDILEEAARVAEEYGDCDYGCNLSVAAAIRALVKP